MIGKKRDHVVLKDVLDAFSEESKADEKNQTFITDEVLIKHGTPPEVIAETAQEQNCDLIIMGTHGPAPSPISSSAVPPNG